MNWKTNYYIDYDNKIDNKYIKYIDIINSYKNITEQKKNITEQKKNIKNELNYQNILIKINNYSENMNTMNTKTALELLEIELDISKVLVIYISQNNYFNYDFIIKILNILYSFSDILRVKLNQKKVTKKNSYNFCKYKDSCIHNYSSNKNICYKDHYIHNKVLYDIEIITNYLKKKYNTTKLIKFEKYILKCITSINYCIKHMTNELKSLCLYANKNEWDSFHNIKIII